MHDNLPAGAKSHITAPADGLQEIHRTGILQSTMDGGIIMAAGYEKTIICLANSRKIPGRSVAGKEINAGKIGPWIRPVSGRTGTELSERERRFINGEEPKPRDIIRIPMIEPRPRGFQIENHLIDCGGFWTKEGETSWGELQDALDSVSGPLWDNSSSSFNGVHDRIEYTFASDLGGSLRLFAVSDFEITVASEGSYSGDVKRKVRGNFTLNAIEYRLAVTDPVIELDYLESGNGEFRVGPALLSVSLGEPYRGYSYKIITGVLRG